MPKWDYINKNLIAQINFESTEIIEIAIAIHTDHKVDYRIKNNDFSDMPKMTSSESMKHLRSMLTSLFATNLNQKYEQLEERCDIKRDTFQRIISGRRGISRTMLAKFVIGANVDMDCADEMFLNLGHSLDARNRFDYILMCALRDKDDIDVFNDDLMKYGYPSIFSNPD